MRKLVYGSLALMFGCFSALTAAQNPVVAPYSRDLVILRGTNLVAFDAREFLQARYTVLYFSAGWCPDCRKFSPKLVDAYDRQKPGQPRFEVLLVSQDHSETEMRQYMINERMRWPALAYTNVSDAEAINKFHPEKPIPWLAVLDVSGKAVLQSKNDEDAVEVLQQLLARIKK